MENNRSKDIIVLNMMLLNPELFYIEGYKNIYYENGENKNQNHNIIKSYISLSNELNKNWNYFTRNIKNDNKRFINMKKNISSIDQNNIHNSQNSNTNSNNIISSSSSVEIKINENNISDNDLKIIDADHLSIISKEESEDNSDPDLNKTVNYLQSLFYYDNDQNFEDNNNIDLNINVNNPTYILEKKEDSVEMILIESAYDSLQNDLNEQLKPEISKNEEKDNKMTIVLNIKGENKSLEVNSNQKVSEVLPQLLKKDKNNYYIGICNYKIINEEETFIDNKINNIDKVFLYSKSDKGNNSILPILEEDDKEILYFLLNVFKSIKFAQYRWELREAVLKKSKSLPKFNVKMNPKELIRFLMIRTEIIPPGIAILEHEHKLVCCLTNDNWKCNQCQKTYESHDEKFFCSLCNYYMCHECRKQKYYERRKTIKKEVIPDKKIIEESKLSPILDKENHKLIYCITSRNYLGETFWDCNKCNQEKNSGWGFYCTFCDYDVCIKCFHKMKNKSINV